MSQNGSLGVLIPTRNSAALLPAHLRSMEAWLELAAEVVVVDSFSTDGTNELIEQGVKHPRRTILSHPPGLYASWNAGIQKLNTRYTYISTIGDTITRLGIGELLHAAERLALDVVISKPAFLNPDGTTATLSWPIDDIVRTLQISAPRALNRFESVIFACVNPASALTGSCASDLFRTDVLKRAPFPTEFGTGGDGVWAMREAGQVSWGVVPGCFSTFLRHPTSVSQAENQPRSIGPRGDVILQQTGEQWRQAGLVTESELRRIGWLDLQEALARYLDAKAAFDSCRRARMPWSLNPIAWRARFRRERCLRELHLRKATTLRLAADNRSPESAGECAAPARERCGVL